MHKLCIPILIFICLNLNAQRLDDFKWKNRLVILFGNDSSKALESQKRILQKHEKGVKERDILIFEANDAIKNQLKVSPDFQGLVLIGKDGGIKLKKPFEVPINELFELIDGMPMRKSEIRSKSKY